MSESAKTTLILVGTALILGYLIYKELQLRKVKTGAGLAPDMGGKDDL